MKEPIEYAIKKDVRNNPIVREIDESRQRALWRWVRIGAFLVTVGLFSAWQHFEIIRHGYSIDQMEREHSELEETARRLRLEIETLRSPQRIEALATRELRLIAPSHADALIIERVVPAAPPGGTVVARR